MPADAWGHPWQDWLPALVGSVPGAIAVHTRKTQTYVRMLTRDLSDQALPAVRVAHQLQTDGRTIGFLTGASSDAAITILSQLDFDPRLIIEASATTQTKTRILMDLGTRVYVDDMEIGQEIAGAAGAAFVRVRHDDNEERLMKEITCNLSS